MLKLTLTLLVIITVTTCQVHIGKYVFKERFSECLYENLKNIFSKTHTIILLGNNSILELQLISQITINPIYTIKSDRDSILQFNNEFIKMHGSKSVYEESKVYVAFFNNFDKAQEVIDNIRRIFFWRMRDRLVFVASKKLKKQDVDIFFRLCSKYEIYNVIFVLENCKFYNYNPFKDNFAIKAKYGFFFRDLYKNLWGKELRINLFNNNKDETSLFDDGLDFLTAMNLAGYFNATPRIFQPTDGERYGDISRLTGAIADLVYNHSDVALNSRLILSTYNNLIEYLYPLERDDLVCLVPEKPRVMTTKYRSIFTKEIRILIICFIIIFLMVLKLGIGNVTLISWIGLLLMQPVNSRSTKRGRILLVLFLIYCFYVILFIGSQLSSRFTVFRVPKQLETFEDVENSGMNVYTLPIFKELLLKNGDTEFEEMADRIIILNKTQLENKIKQHGNYGVVLKTSFANYAVMLKENNLKGTVRQMIMKDVAYPGMKCYAIKFGNPLKTHFDKYLTIIHESGIRSHWKKTKLDELFLRESKYYTMNKIDHSPLSLHHLREIFYFYIIGCVASIIVFLIELSFRK